MSGEGACVDRSDVTYSARSRHRQGRFLRTARLNAVGFGALGGVCLVAAALCAPALRRTGWPLLFRAAPGPVVVVTGLVVLDRRKWAGMVTSSSFTDDPAEMRAVADRLGALGLPVSLEERPPGTPVLRYAHRHARQVHAALADMGVPAPVP